jgi:hypothetical protein
LACATAIISGDCFRVAGQPPGQTGNQILTNSPVKSKIQAPHLNWLIKISQSAGLFGF